MAPAQFLPHTGDMRLAMDSEFEQGRPALSAPGSEVVAFLLALFGTFFLAGQAGAEVFTIDHVDVDISARNALAARETAIDWAEGEAFRILLKKLTLEADHDHLPRLSATEVKALVEGIQIDDEKTASRRYLATITVKFSANDVRSLLNSHQIPMAESEARSVLLLPVFEYAGALTLWAKPNDWFEAWRQVDLNNRLQPLMLPEVSFQDLLEISAIQAFRQDDETFKAIQGRYGADTVMTVAATLTTDFEQNAFLLTVDFTGNSPTPALGAELVFRAAPDVTASELLEAAALGIADYLERVWKGQVVLRTDQRETIVAWQRVNDLSDWLKMQETITDNPLVRDLSVRSLRSDSVELEFSHAGTQIQVIAAFALQDVFLVEADGFWEMGFGLKEPAPSEYPELAPLRFSLPVGHEPETPALSEDSWPTTLGPDPY